MTDKEENIIKVGLKSNANFLFSQMNGDTMGGAMGRVFYRSVVFLTEKQFESFKTLIVKFGGDVEMSLTVNKREEGDGEDVDYGCYFIKDK